MIAALLFQVQMTVSAGTTDPVLLLKVPGRAETAIEVIFPEHVTVRARGSSDVEHLYRYRADRNSERPSWKHAGTSLQYERELPHGIHMLARATQQSDGVLFHYEFANRSNVDYEMIYAVTDPRMKSIFHDEQLARTYVHHSTGFELLASEAPNVKLPARYLASYTWPVQPQRVDVHDGIRHYYKSRKVDEPFIATVSSDRQWVAASFTRTVGNVWSNPELTCQHVDPQKPLAAGGTVVLEVKFLLIRGTLEDAHRIFQREWASLR